MSEANINGVHYRNSSFLNQFMNSYTIDVMIVSRYIHHFLEFDNKALKTYIWFHDTLAHPAWRGMLMPKNGYFLLKNIIDKIDGIVVLSEWHKKNVINNYNDIDTNKIFIIGNAIDVSRYADKKVNRVKNRFIYTSNPSRGLTELVNNFASIRKEIPDAELWVYRGEDEFKDYKPLLELIKSSNYIKFMGRIDNEDLAKHQLAADFWYYPTAYHETFCISALEALAAGCICVTSNLAALKDIIGDRGVLLEEKIHSEYYFKEATDKIVKISRNEDIKEQIRVKGIEWAMKQSWPARAIEWLQLIGYKNDNHFDTNMCI